MKSDPEEVKEIRKQLRKHRGKNQVFRIKKYSLSSSATPSCLVCDPKLVEIEEGSFKIVAITGKGEKRTFFLGGPPQKEGYKYSALIIEPVDSLELLTMINDYQKNLGKVAMENGNIAYGIRKYLERKDD